MLLSSTGGQLTLLRVEKIFSAILIFSNAFEEWKSMRRTSKWNRDGRLAQTSWIFKHSILVTILGVLRLWPINIGPKGHHTIHFVMSCQVSEIPGCSMHNERPHYLGVKYIKNNRGLMKKINYIPWTSATSFSINQSQSINIKNPRHHHKGKHRYYAIQISINLSSPIKVVKKFTSRHPYKTGGNKTHLT